MPIEQQGPSEEEILKYEGQRTLSDAELIRQGAKYERSEKGNIELRVPQKAINKIHDEWEEAHEGLKTAEKLKDEVLSQTDEQLDSHGGWRKVSQAAQLYEVAGKIEEAKVMYRKLAVNDERHFDLCIQEGDEYHAKQMGRDWMETLAKTGDQGAIEAAKRKIETSIAKFPRAS